MGNASRYIFQKLALEERKIVLRSAPNLATTLEVASDFRQKSACHNERTINFLPAELITDVRRFDKRVYGNCVI